MAKQTFTTGSVLTATQMNNLQANDYNWTVSQKTASYVLVAADAGTRIEMNSGSATTVTVNTGLFTAGDTLFIQNIGAGACTVTAGTATVNKATAGSLTLAQYQGGTLYFVSASSAIFFADAGYTPPLTTKGDLFGYDTAAARIPIGSNNQVLTADSTQALGLKWATPATGGMTLISTTTLSGSSTAITNIPTTYNDLQLVISGYKSSSGSTFLFAFGSAGVYTTHNWVYNQRNAGAASVNSGWNNTAITIAPSTSASVDNNEVTINIYNYNNTIYKYCRYVTAVANGTDNSVIINGAGSMGQSSSGIPSNTLTLSTGAGNLSGTAYLYGVK